MSVEENKRILRRLGEELINQGDLEPADELYSSDSVDHMPAPGQVAGPEGVKRDFARIRASFPDWHQEIEDVIAEGDKVVVRWRSTGTHSGDFMGLPATGIRASWTGVGIFRLEDGKIVERWSNWDALGLMQQLSKE